MDGCQTRKELSYLLATAYLFVTVQTGSVVLKSNFQLYCGQMSIALVVSLQQAGVHIIIQTIIAAGSYISNLNALR